MEGNPGDYIPIPATQEIHAARCVARGNRAAIAERSTLLPGRAESMVVLESRDLQQRILVNVNVNVDMPLAGCDAMKSGPGPALGPEVAETV